MTAGPVQHEAFRQRQMGMLRWAWRRWACGRQCGIRELAAAGRYRTLTGRGARRAINKLVEAGWLAPIPCEGIAKHNSGYTVGPRFGGVDKAGRVYGVIG